MKVRCILIGHIWRGTDKQRAGLWLYTRRCTHCGKTQYRGLDTDWSGVKPESEHIAPTLTTKTTVIGEREMGKRLVQLNLEPYEIEVLRTALARFRNEFEKRPNPACKDQAKTAQRMIHKLRAGGHIT